jgi:hypothetical protein
MKRPRKPTAGEDPEPPPKRHEPGLACPAPNCKTDKSTPGELIKHARNVHAELLTSSEFVSALEVRAGRTLEQCPTCPLVYTKLKLHECRPVETEQKSVDGGLSAAERMALALTKAVEEQTGLSFPPPTLTQQDSPTGSPSPTPLPFTHPEAAQSQSPILASPPGSLFSPTPSPRGRRVRTPPTPSPPQSPHTTPQCLPR